MGVIWARPKEKPDGDLRRFHFLQPCQRQADRGGAAIRRAETGQALAPAQIAARLPRRHEPLGYTRSLALDRAGAWSVALSDLARITRGGDLFMGEQGGGFLARMQVRRHALDW